MNENQDHTSDASMRRRSRWWPDIFGLLPRNKIRRMRESQDESRWEKGLAELRVATGENRMRIQVCPHGCSHQFGRRDVIARTKLSGKAEIRVEYGFETSNCPICGAAFQRECGRCRSPIFAPVADRCESCGLPHPWGVGRRATATRSQPRQWRRAKDNPSPAVLIRKPTKDTELFVVDGDITTFAIDAVISDDDTDGRMWAAVASSIKTAAGADIERDSASRGPYPLGSAWFTYGGNLPTRGIIHVAAMDRNGKNDGVETIRTCVRSALTEALARGMESVALAAIGTWPQNIALGTYSQAIALDTWLTEIPPDIVKFLRGLTAAKLAVLLVLYEPEDFGRLHRLLEEAIESV